MTGSEGLSLAVSRIHELYNKGYSPMDIIGTLFKVIKNFDQSMLEYIKLEYIKEVSFVHMRILNGVNTLLQLTGLIARLCIIADGVLKNK